MPRKPTRPSLLDLEPKHGPTERRRLNWMLWQRPRYDEFVRNFEATYGERPIFWKHFVTRQVDLYMTHPENALAVHREDGRLVSDARLHRLAWGAKIDTLAAERRRHLPPQVVGVLDGDITADEWLPEILQRFYCNRDREQELAELLRESSLGYSLEIERHKGVVRVFGAPGHVNHIFRLGVEQGLLSLEKR
jgi:hypothetical protein